MEAVQSATGWKKDWNFLLPASHGSKERLTAVQVAAKRGFLDALELLLAKGARADFEEGESALVLALRGGHEDCVRVLLEYGANPFVVNDEDSYNEDSVAIGLVREAKLGPDLINAARLGDLEAVKKFASLGAHVTNQRDEGGWSALHGACYANSSPIVRVLIKQGAKIEAATSQGYTALIEACATKKTAVCEALIQHGANVDAVDQDCWTPLHYAAAEKAKDIVKLLLSAGADVIYPNEVLRTDIFIYLLLLFFFRMESLLWMFVETRKSARF